MRGIIFAVPFAASLIIIVLFLILAGILLMRVFSLTKDTVVYFFEGFFSPPTPLEKALICYYHICANTGEGKDKGCRHPNAENWCRDAEILSIINYEEICSLPSALKVDGEQCRKAYWQFPLRINLNEPQEVRVKTLRSKRNVDSGKEYVFLLRPVEGGIYTGSKDASFTIGKSVKLVNFVNEENLPPSYPSCPGVNICLESATVDKSSYEISGIIYKKGGIYVPMDAKWALSAYYSFYSSGQSSEGKVNFKIDRELYGINERLLRISVDAEKKQGDQLKDYNYILNLTYKADEGKLYISFWGDGKESISSYSCYYHKCKDSEIVFETSRRGHIRVKIKDINTSCWGEGTATLCFVDHLTLKITYEKPIVRPS
jgi:hypothetical protein